MKSDRTTDTILASLDQLLAMPDLPAPVGSQGKRLRARLTTPVRVVLAGFPGSGKTQLLNLLAGSRIVADGRALPSLLLTYGDAPRTVLTRADDRDEVQAGHVLDPAALRHAVQVTLEAPLPVLRRLSLLEVVTDASIESQRTALEWAAARADILIWCSQEFADAEQLLWRRVPDALKDHGFLVLTKADELHRAGLLSQRIAALDEIVAEEFYSLHPVATLQALSALGRADGSGDAALTASGGRGLIGAVVKHVDQGRRADIDNAMLFLRRHAALAPGAAEPAPAPAAGSEAASAAGPAAAASAASAAAPTPPESDALHAEAARFLRGRAADLCLRLDAGETGNFGTLLNFCAETVDTLADMFLESEPGVTISPLHEEIMEAADMMLLLRLEEGAGPAEDAATLMLQLKREIDVALAA